MFDSIGNSWLYTSPMEHPPGSHNSPEHRIDIQTNGNNASSTQENSSNSTEHHEAYTTRPSLSLNLAISSTPTTDNEAGHGHQISYLLSLKVLVQLIFGVSQITACIVVLMRSRHKKPSLLMVWIISYAAGWAARLPLIFLQSDSTCAPYRFRNLPHDVFDAAANIFAENQDRDDTSGRHRFCRRTVETYKNVLNLFFVFLLLFGILVLTIKGFRSPGGADDLYRCQSLGLMICMLFLLLLTLSFFWYSWDILQLMILLCIVPSAMLLFCCVYLASALGFHGTQLQSDEAYIAYFNALPTHKYKLQRNGNDTDGETTSGVVAAGTDRERAISGEDAVCCICLAGYSNNDELKELPCAHLFHSSCVKKWLKIKAFCPLCKCKISENFNRLPPAQSTIDSV